MGTFTLHVECLCWMCLYIHTCQTINFWSTQ